MPRLPCSLAIGGGARVGAYGRLRHSHGRLHKLALWKAKCVAVVMSLNPKSILLPAVARGIISYCAVLYRGPGT